MEELDILLLIVERHDDREIVAPGRIGSADGLGHV
jgi:hypothetical protein